MRKYLKKIYRFIIVCVVLLSTNSYAKIKNNYGEVISPVAEDKDSVSDGIIIQRNLYGEYNSFGKELSGESKVEYDSVDNYNIDLKTLNLRIKYFAPTYLNIRQSALSSYTMAYYIRGGNDTLMFDALSYTEDLISEYKNAYENCIGERNALSNSDPDYQSKYTALTAEILTYKHMYSAAKSTINKSINATKTMLGLGNALYNMGNVDNNGKVTFAREAIEKSLSSAILSCLQLETYNDILEKQTDLYYDMYELYKKNETLGLATSNDVLESFSAYENTKDIMQKTKTTLKSVKEQIANNLGYSISDIDKLNFVDPDIDLSYMSTINYEVDKVRAYTSNEKYYSISINEHDRKRPGSTGEVLLKKRQDYIKEKVITEFENVYSRYEAALLSYEAGKILDNICKINKDANLRKLNNKMVSELEYKGLELQNYADLLQVKVSKYNLINAYNEYYFATLGHLDIT